MTGNPRLPISRIEALKSAPKNGAILYELGCLYQRQGKLAQAAECYRQALQAAYGPGP